MWEKVSKIMSTSKNNSDSITANITTNITNNMKEDKNMKNTVNINTTKKANRVSITKQMGVSYLTFDNIPVGVISDDHQKENVKCIQYMVEACDINDPNELACQCATLTTVMADLNGIDLSNTVEINGVEYAVDTYSKCVAAENGQKLFELKDIYPELEDEELPIDMIEGILVSEIPNYAIVPVAKHNQKDTPDGVINITKPNKPSVFETIRGLEALGMRAEWVYVDGKKQPSPLCYCGEADMQKFMELTQKCVETDLDWYDTMISACNYKVNDLMPDDEVYTLGKTGIIIDYKRREAWTVDGYTKVADLEDVQSHLPNNVVKLMLLKRAKKNLD